ncbi:MAG: 16S rRNA (cytidine(1402)-2'-O)-methyltransferase [Nautilia sp.]|nr:MAG: 16S rRNA (cytidine(1402)-2'-O)-methyltransferase [Nautilia sp.]
MLTFVPTPIGNLLDISERAKIALSESDIIFCEDTRVTKKLLNLLQIDYLNKIFYSMHSHNEQEIISKLDIAIFEKNVVYVSDAGMPGISDPGSKLIQFAQKNNVEYDVIPGANAVLTAFVASGFEGEWTFFGFLPHKGQERSKKLNEVINHDKISILYESPHRIEKLLNELKEFIPERVVFFAKELTKKHQTFIKDYVKNIELSNIKGEWVVVIDKGVKNSSLTLNYEDILNLKLPLKEKAKLLSKISTKSTKEIYNELVNL